MTVKNAFYAQSGGVTSVINASACGVLETARAHSDKIGKVYAGHNGIIGALREELIDTSLESDADIAALKHTPGGAFGSCRYKLKDIKTHKAEYERLIEVFKAHNIGYFFYNGGNDSSDTAYKVSQISEQLGYPIISIGIPKTVDNDLPITDCCPGFGSVAKYISTSIMEASLDIQSMCESSTKIFVMEVMGRHAGWIAAAAGLAQREEGGAPQIILFPETPFDKACFLRRVDEVVKRDGFCAIVVSEGAQYADGRFLSDAGVTDAFGHTQLGGVAPFIANMIKSELGYKYHWAVADYLQRSARHISSATDLDQAYAVGKAAVDLALAGKNAVMPVIVREQDSPYKWSIGEAPLAKIANVEKKMPKEFITEDGFGITEAARRYLQPLIQGESYPPYKNGVPDYVKLKNQLVAKKLAHSFNV
ncbi:diphosphate--fructose-6-phosphate 1-phosphotransferase [Hahella sp. KA22]|uniref:6-phosphofructokinase n=1 Tax=Hahella sp. KA22 TaxID=1628392 RepID=UPI000FDCF124|nr:6-phosphofructokinase [Hahella sp. KA22]AZZ90570.1 6-phosphofructokinase [Hahella sp. KA22]QAY53940.1 diphosphate--fructose-6-phosphate 1-phosphotransferase [Hahella sp. KA22]